MFKMKMFSILILLYTSLYSVSCFTQKSAKFKFASYFGDHMVLQKEPQKATIWGYASKLQNTVWISVNDISVNKTITRPGPLNDIAVWSLQLPPMHSGGPHTIKAESSEGEVTLSDVLFGDVWICSGQSNMQFTLGMGLNASLEIADSANHPNIRVFTVSVSTSSVPQFDFFSIAEDWSIPSYESIGNVSWSYFSAVCWLYGKYLSEVLNYPIGLIAASYQGTPIEVWSSQDALKQCPSGQTSNKVTNKKESIPGRDLMYLHYPSIKNTSYVNASVPLQWTNPSVLWNSMIHPLVNMTIYGVIWYQGESNALPGSGTNLYNCRFPAMIDDWRKKFTEGSKEQTSEIFPFGFVQLAPWRDNYGITTGFPDIRWHQTADYGYVPNARMKNVFMAVAMDLPDFTAPYQGLHPRDKQDVAKRLCTEGLAVGYKRSDFIKLRGPFPSDFQIFNDSVIITFDNRTTTIETQNTVGFEACCASHSNHSKPGAYCKLDVWFPAPIKATDRTSVTLTAACPSSTRDIVAIRYAWRESPCLFKKCAVYNKLSGYPAPPFVKHLLWDLNES